jgi:hypothetical protein
MKKAKEVHRLLEEVDLTINTDADRVVLDSVLGASRKSASPVSAGDARRIPVEAGLGWRFAFWRVVGCAAAALFAVSSWIALDLRRDVADLKHELAQTRQDVPVAEPDNTTTINLYLKEHKDVVARYASQTQAAVQPLQMRVSQQDIMYYEILGDGPGYLSPGIIVSGPSSPRRIDSPAASVISNGHTLTLSEAQDMADFGLRAPARLFPGYSLDQIRRIEGRDALQLLYTNGIDSISLFEQSLDGRRGLEAKDFRQYAVYRQSEQAGGTILAWRDDEVFYVLIGNIEMSQLMDMAQSISASK